MNINDYIVKTIKPFTPTDTVAQAKKVCENFPVSHVLIVENNNLVGCLSEDDIRTIECSDCHLQEYNYLLNRYYADSSNTILELITLFADNNCSILPVLDRNQNYIGYYDLADILDVLANVPFLKRGSQTLVVAIDKIDFLMSQIAQIVESNSAKLLALYISQETSDSIEVTLKMETNQINEIIQTFRRYEYRIVSQHIEDEYLDSLKDRASYLRKYLDF